MKRKDWDCRNSAAPSSPWGKIQTALIIQRGVRFVETAGHGGIMIAKKTAEKLLSPQARELAEPFGNYFCFEEDCAASIPLYEHPEWMKGLFEETTTKEDLKRDIEHWFPQYFLVN